MRITLWCFLKVFIYHTTYVLCYEVPPALVEPLSPRGLRVSIPDHEGITLFAFHGNVNVDFEMGREAGQMAADVLRKKNGRWTYINRNLSLKKGDIIYYWLYVIHNGLGKERLFQDYTVTKFFNENGQPLSGSTSTDVNENTHKQPECKSSVTLINGEPQCGGKLIFDVQFKDKLDRKLTHVVQISDRNEECVVYDSHTDNSYLENGNLCIKPTLLDDRYGADFTAKGNLDITARCTSIVTALCTRQTIGKHFLPPVLSARLTTKDSFSFRYGVVEVKAKLPLGDWIVPELWLLPKLIKYGEASSGKIVIASAFGNERLNYGSEEIGNRKLYRGLQVGKNDRGYKTYKANDLWSSEFHVYKLIWKPDSISFLVDNVEHGHWSSTSDPSFLNDKNDKIAPFNEEFYLVIGLGVGGTVFPDGSVSNGHTKPWNNTNADIMRRLYIDKNNWYPTWKEASKLQVEYVKVWAL